MTTKQATPPIRPLDPTGVRCSRCGAHGAPDECWNCGLDKVRQRALLRRIPTYFEAADQPF